MSTTHRVPRRRLSAAVVAVLVVGAAAAGLGAMTLASASTPPDTQQTYARDGETCTTSSTGYCTVSHGLGTTPEYVGVSNSGVVLIGIDAKTSATFRVRFAKSIANNGVVTPYASTAVRFDWSAVYTPPAPEPTTPPATTTPAPTTTAPAAGWPDGTNTGVPAGTTLKAYTGPCTITSTVTLDGVDARSCGSLLIHAANVVIRNSVLPRIDATDGYGTAYSVNLSDSTVQAGAWSDGAVWGYNITGTRLNVTGGQHSVHCNDHCTIVDSWLHGQYHTATDSFHNNAFITNGGTDMLLRHNTLHCDPPLNTNDGGCTADVSLFGDFDPVTHVTVEGNLLKANNSSISYCAYGGYQPAKQYPVSTYIVYRDNVFERGANGKCGVYGPATSWKADAVGNIWSENTWDSSEPVPAP